MMTATRERTSEENQKKSKIENPSWCTENEGKVGDDDNIVHDEAWQERMSQQSRKAIHDFFYPSVSAPSAAGETSGQIGREDSENELFVEQFWKYYDDIVILSIFTQLGIIFRLAAAGWFAYFDSTFRHGTALFVNLPLNCLSTFLLGLMCSGEDAMAIVETRFTPYKRQYQLKDENHNDGDEIPNLTKRMKRLRRRKRHRIHHPVRISNTEFREVQLINIETRMRASKSLLFFPIKKEEADIMDSYFTDGYQKDREASVALNDLELQLEEQDDDDVLQNSRETVETAIAAQQQKEQEPKHQQKEGNHDFATETDRDLDQIIYDVGTQLTSHVQDEFRNLHSNINQMTKASLSDGWDAGTSPDEMSEDLMLGLRDGFCGALSSFSSWNSSMVALIKNGDIGSAIVGYMLGLQLPIISYRFGQHLAVYIFVWRCRRKNRRDERRGYGMKLNQSDDDDEDEKSQESAEERELPSVRAIATAIFVMLVIAQVTSLSFYNEPGDQQLAISLLFSPLGVLARWRLSKYNSIRPGFPLGTFCCNLLACALSGSLGTLLAGNPGPRERTVLVGIISGFGGTLSSVAAFVLEILRGMDPLLLRWDGVMYAGCTLFWGMAIGLVAESGMDWADRWG